MVDQGASTSDQDLTLQSVSVGTGARRRALWGVLAAVVVVTGAVVVSSGGDSGPPRLPVALGSSAGREGATASTAADMALARVTYVAGDGLPALGGEAPAYRLDGTVDVGRVRTLAAALGVKGDPTHDGRLWHVESGDAVLEVSEDGGGTWWYSPSSGSTSGGSRSSGSGSAGCDPAATECAVDTPSSVPMTTIPDGVCANDGSTCPSESVTTVCPANTKCIEPLPPVSEPCPAGASCTVPVPPEPVLPADLPSKAEARKIALDVLTATGMDLSDAKVTVDGPYDAWYVSVEPRLDGTPLSGSMASVGVGSKGAIASAAGMLDTPQRLGSYPLIDTRAAIDRLNALGPGYSGLPVPMGAPGGVARDSGVATADAPMPTRPCQPDDPSCATLVAPGKSTTTVVSQCTVQPDGTEVCQSTGVPSVPPDPGTVECLKPAVEPGADPAVSAPTTTAGGCGPVGICVDTVPPVPADGGTVTTLAPSPECTIPIPYPEPTPVEITLTDAERVLTLLPASDGSGVLYVVPGYRFSNADGAIVEVVAVADDSLAPTTTAPDATNTSVVTPSTTCETIVEGDGSGTTHTLQTCPQPPAPEPIRLAPGQTPELGVGYYVEVNTHCGTLLFADRWWATDAPTPLPWSTRTEGGTFTLNDPDDGKFAGDAAGTDTAEFTARGPAADVPACD